MNELMTEQKNWRMDGQITFLGLYCHPLTPLDHPSHFHSLPHFSSPSYLPTARATDPHEQGKYQRGCRPSEGPGQG